MRKLKKLKETSRGGRRQVLIRNDWVRSICESVSRETGYPFQKCFDELIEMLVMGFVLGVNTKDQLYNRIIKKL